MVHVWANIGKWWEYPYESHTECYFAEEIDMDVIMVDTESLYNQNRS